MQTETHKRTLVRSISYRLMAWLITIMLTYFMTGNFSESTGFSTILHLVLVVVYYIHERFWLKINWGRQ